MKIEYIKGDLFQTHHPYILHGCNSHGVMGSGVAKLIREKYPRAYEKYTELHNAKGLELGEVQFVRCEDKIIINAITQENYGRNGSRFASYDAIAAAIQEIDKHIYEGTVAMPMIGAGLGGGDWRVIEAIIESEFKFVQPVVYVI